MLPQLVSSESAPLLVDEVERKKGGVTLAKVLEGERREREFYDVCDELGRDVRNHAVRVRNEEESERRTLRASGAVQGR